MKIKFPASLKKLLSTLNASGQAFIVGGAVRDLLRGEVPHDWDVTTNLLPDQVQGLAKENGFQVIDNLGTNFGVTVVIVDGDDYEVATFRGERYSENGDHRHPDQVWFCDSLIDDLSRRDFTINAMAMSIDGEIIDPFGGVADLQNGVLRCVGDAHQRFGEDALRMWRACRFASKFGMDFDESSFDCSLIGGQSKERVRTEIEKILLSDHPEKGLRMAIMSGLANTTMVVNGEEVAVLPELQHLVALPQNPKYHYADAFEHTVDVVCGAPSDLLLRWAALLHDVAKGLEGIRDLNKEGQPCDIGHEIKSAEIAEVTLSRFGYKDSFIKRVVWLIANHMAPTAFNSRKAIQKFIRKVATSGVFRKNSEMVEASYQLVAIHIADMNATNSKSAIEKFINNGKLMIKLAEAMPCHTSDLKIKGKDVIEAGLQPREVLNALLTTVQSGNLSNTREALLAKLLKMKG